MSESVQVDKSRWVIFRFEESRDLLCLSVPISKVSVYLSSLFQ